jgi:hypothetical protein
MVKNNIRCNISFYNHCYRFNSNGSGSSLFIVIGVLSLLAVIVTFLFYSTRSRIAVTKIHDQNKVVRYFLESYAGDILFQLRENANNKETKVYEQFRQALKNLDRIDIDTGFYDKSELLKFMETNPFGMLRSSHSLLEPQIYMTQPQPLKLPEMFDISEYKTAEYQSHLSISCGIELNDKKYRLKVEYPFKLVSLALPLLREFVFFADQLHLEQSDAFENDKINLVGIKDGEIAPSSGKPIIIGPNQAEEKTETLGQIFFGSDNKPVYLNIAGEKIFRSGKMNDLWMITPEFLDPVKADTPEFISHVLGFYSGRYFRTVKIPVTSDKFVFCYVLGFSTENLDPVNGHFAKTSLNFRNLFSGDPAFERLEGVSDDSVFAKASAIKPYGIKPEKEEYYLGPNRRIYGDVFSRFFMFSRFEWYDNGLRRSDLPHDSIPDGIPFETQPGTNYEHYMTRIVSAGLDYDYNRPVPFHYCPTNRNDKVLPERIRAKDFVGIDGLKLKKGFANYASEFLLTNLRPEQRVGNVANTIWQRVTYEFATQKEFKRFVKAGENEFRVNGICYIKDDLNLSDGIVNEKIVGGIVLVDGDITLGNIDRGLDFNDDKMLEETAINLPASEVLTFVSFGKNSQIRLTGTRYMGLHLVNLQNNLNEPVKQLVFQNPDESFKFFGAIAVSTPDLEGLTEFFQVWSPYIRFVSSLGDPEPPTAVQIDMTPENYMLFVDK